MPTGERLTPLANLSAELWREAAFGWRRLRAAPLFTVFSIVTLALGIGVTTAVYSALYASMWRPLGVRDGRAVVVVSVATATHRVATPLSWPDYQDFLAQQTMFSGVAAWMEFGSAFAANGTAELISGEGVSGSFFATLGVAPAMGRAIQAADDRSDAPPVAMLSHATWRGVLRSDPAIVGASVKIGGRPYEVIGVAPASFRGLGGFGFRQAAVWIPMAAALAVSRENGWRVDVNDRNMGWVRLAARMVPGRGLTEASTDIGVIGQRLDAVAPLSLSASSGLTEAQRRIARNWTATSAVDSSIFGESSDAARAILTLPALVLLIACTNLANLVMSRGASRRHEFAVRRALGASRWRLIREQLVEHAMIAVAGGLTGIVVTRALLTFAAATIQDTFGYTPEYRMDVGLDPAVLAAVAGAVLLSLAVAGLIPAWQLTRGAVRAGLASNGGGAVSPRWRGRGNLIALQVGASVALLLVAALCVRQVMSLAVKPAQVNLHQIAVVNVPFGFQKREEASVRRTLDVVIDTARRAPGVDAAAVVTNPRFLHSLLVAVTSPERPFQADWSRPKDHAAPLLSATPEIFRVLGVAIRFGRSFDGRDGPGAPPVAVVNENLARALFGTADVTGRQLVAGSLSRRGDWDVVNLSKIERFEIIGVAADTVTSLLGGADDIVYVPFAQKYTSDVAIYARAVRGDAAPYAGLLRTAVQRADPEVAVSFAGRADAAAGGPSLALGLVAQSTGALALLALTLSMAGLYGVLSHVVARRTRELGVRMALGADAGRIARLVLKDGVRPVVEGLVIGLGVAAGVRLGMQPLFEQPITAIDPIAFVIALVPLVAAASIACYLPARRAGRVDPNVALREL